MPEINETPSIDNELTIIENATFGEEVRQAIIDALTKCYTDVIAAALSGIKKGDSIDTVAISNGELIVTILNNETSETTTVNCGTVVGSDGSDGAGIQSIRLDTTLNSPTYGHLFIQVQGQSEIDVGYIIGPKGDPGETAPEHEWNVDGSLNPNSVNPVQNRALFSAFNSKLDKASIDSAFSTVSTNPVQNKVITAKLNEIIAGKIDKASIDSAFSTVSTNPVQNKVITAKLNEIIAGKIDKVSIGSNYILISNGSGGIKNGSKLIGDSNNFHSENDSNYLAVESAVKQYTYSKSESDNTFVKNAQIDQELDEESENPVQNKVIAEKFQQIENDYSAPDPTIDITSTKPVQNHAVAEALNGKVNTNDFHDLIFDDIDTTISSTNGGVYYNGDCPAAPALFIEGVNDSSEYSGYKYYLSYVDSLYDSDDNPHWHRIADITYLIKNSVNIDSSIDSASNNPVKNSAISEALSKKYECKVIQGQINNIASLDGYTDENTIYTINCSFIPLRGIIKLIFVKSDDPQPGLDLYANSSQFIFTENGNIFSRATDATGAFGSLVMFNKGIQIDGSLSANSENPVQNKVIKAALDALQQEIDNLRNSQ